MKVSKKALALVLSVAMVVSSFAGTTAFAADKGSLDLASAELSYSPNQSGGGIVPLFDTSNMLRSGKHSRLGQNASFEDSYNLVKDSGMTPNLRDQASWGTCWAFSALGSAESSLYDEEHLKDSQFSARHLAYFTYNSANNPDVPEDGTQGDTYWAEDPFQNGGNVYMAIATLAREEGAELESEVPYPAPSDFNDDFDAPEFNTVDPEYQFDSVYQLKEANFLPNKDADGNLDGSAIKQALLGGTSVSVFLFYMRPYLVQKVDDVEYPTYFNNNRVSFNNHLVQIVGWDDTISAENFSDESGNSPDGDGGWLIRNSWGEQDDHGCGYFYISYEDSTMAMFCTLDMDRQQNRYAHNYQYDGLGMCNQIGISEETTPVKMANVFTATGDQTLDAVSFYTTDPGAEYSIQVYTELSGSDPTHGIAAYETEQSGTEEYAGYHTIGLNRAVNLSEGDKYSVVVSLKNVGGGAYPVAVEYGEEDWSVTDIEENQSYLYNGTNWYDLKDINEMGDESYGNVCLKAFTTDGQTGFTPTKPSQPSKPSKPSKHHHSNDSSDNDSFITAEPFTPSTIAPTKNEDGVTTVTVTCVPDSTPTVSGNTSTFSVTVPTNAASAAISSGTVQQHARVDVTLPNDTIISQLNNSAVQSVVMTIKAPSNIAYGTAPNVDVSIMLDAAVLQAAAAAKKDVTISILDQTTGKVAYTWTFKGSDLAQSGNTFRSINLAATTLTTTLDAEVSRTIPASVKGVVLSFADNGVLPAVANISVYVGDQGFHAGQPAYLYYYNEDTKQLETVGNNKLEIDANCYAHMPISHCSKYVLLPAQVTAVTPVKLDTGRQLSVKAGKSYQFKVTASRKPTFISGNSAVFQVKETYSKGNNYFFKVTAVGKVGAGAGFYVNGEKTPRTIATIIK
ncbi:MAG: lectin like domain-containing protein [Oscillospiraceae bacterium]|jgi:C1A family cysteine protease|nr:lectin like domain-containing protein [Oscillospiraceae bacterium]